MTKRIAVIAGLLLLSAPRRWSRLRSGRSKPVRQDPPPASVGRAQSRDPTQRRGARAGRGRPTVTCRRNQQDARDPPLRPAARHGAASHPLPVQASAGRGDPLRREERRAVLWQRNPRLEHPIASLTKMMTALIVAQRQPARGARDDQPRRRRRHPGSATGLLPRGKRVPLEPLLQALIMISANDAAVALAEHDGGTRPRFVKEMNRQANGDGARLHSLLHAERAARPQQLLLPGRPCRARPGRPGESAHRSDRADALRQAALPDQGQAPVSLEQPLLPAAGARRTAPGAGHGAEDRVHGSCRPVLRDHSPDRRAPAGRGA